MHANIINKKKLKEYILNDNKNNTNLNPEI